MFSALQAIKSHSTDLIRYMGKTHHRGLTDNFLKIFRSVILAGHVMYLCMNTYTHITYICMYMYMYIYIYICIHIDVYI